MESSISAMARWPDSFCNFLAISGAQRKASAYIYITVMEESMQLNVAFLSLT